MKQELSLSTVTALPFEECLWSLREAARREGFQVLAEVPFHSEFQQHVGLPWKKYTVLVVWSPFLAYQALLSDRDAGIFMPFHFVVAEGEDSTLVAATDHALFAGISGRLGVVVLARHLTNKIRLIFSELAALEKVLASPSAAKLNKEAS